MLLEAFSQLIFTKMRLQPLPSRVLPQTLLGSPLKNFGKSSRGRIQRILKFSGTHI